MKNYWENIGGDKRTVVLSAALLFFIITAFIILKATRDALFLSRYPAKYLPYAMGANTIISALAAALYLRLSKYVTIDRIVQASFVIFIGGTLLLWREFIHHYHFLSAIAYLWIGIFGTLAPVQAWSLISTRFLTREAKSSIGLIGAGGTLGGVVGGLISRWMSSRHTVATLLPVACVMIFAALVSAFLMKRSEEQEQVAPTTSASTSSIRRQTIILLFSAVAIGTIVSAFMDFQFKTLAQREWTSAAQLAHFFGSFYAILGIVTLFVQLIGIPIFMRRFGVASSLSVLPLSLLTVNTALLLTRVFPAVVALRGTEEVFRFSIDRSALEILYVAIPQQIRIRLKGIIDTIAVRIADGGASILLIVFFSWMTLPIHYLTIIDMILMSLWLGCTLLLGRHEYPLVLKQQLRRNEMDMESVKADFFTKEFYRFLPELLQNAEDETVLSLLDLLRESRKRWLGRYLVIALKRDHPEIRKRALQLLFEQDGNVANEVKELLNDKDDVIRAEAIHYLKMKSALSAKSQQKLETEDDLVVRAALVTSSSKSLADVKKLFEQSRAESNIAARLELAHVLEFSNISEIPNEIYMQFILDAPLEVKKAGLRLVARKRPQQMIPALLTVSRITTLEDEVRSALSSYGKQLIPYLADVLHSEKQTISQKKMALKVAADIRSLPALELLLQSAASSNLTVRFTALKALNRLKREDLLPQLQPRLQPLLEQELNAVRRQLERLNAFSPKRDGILRHVLNQQIMWGFERIFRLLGLIYPIDSIYFAYRAWRSDDARNVDNALELLEQTLTPELREQLFPLIESHDTPTEPSEPEMTHRKFAFLSYLKDQDPVLVAAAIHDLTSQEFDSWSKEIKCEENFIVEETLERRQKKMDDNHPLTTIQKMESLSKVEIFSQLGSAELLFLANHAQECYFETDDVIYSEGSASTEFTAIVHGEVESVKSGERMNVLRNGECVGLHSVLTNQPRMFTFTATQPTFCLTIAADAFWEILEDDTTFCRAIIEMLVKQIEDNVEARHAAPAR